jgi:hypothetical protein
MNTKNDAPCKLFTVDGLDREKITQIAFETGFCKRRSGKIDPPDFLLHFCLQSLEGTVSYNDLAARVEAKTGVNASRQAYQQRMGEECVNFFKKILETVMNSKNSRAEEKVFEKDSGIKRVLVQDSTIIRLPLRLFEIFSGVKNASSSVCNARIQGVYDLISRQFIQFSIDTYKKTISQLPWSLLLNQVI